MVMIAVAPDRGGMLRQLPEDLGQVVENVAAIFGLTTIGTMLAIVCASSLGLSKLPFRKLERYSHALAGLAILLSGGAIKFLGL